MEYYLSVLTFTLVGSITPGPNNMMLMSSGLNYGIRRSMPHYFGICVGFPIMLITVGIGLGTIFIQFPILHTLIKIAGIVYLVYLAWKIANAGNPKLKNTIAAPMTFMQAAIFQWLNPKAWVLAVGAIATFTIAGEVYKSLSFIVFAYVVTGMSAMALWLCAGAGLKKLLRSEKRIRAFNITMGVLLLLSVIPMALSSLN